MNAEQIERSFGIQLIESEYYESGPHLRFQVYYAFPKEGYTYVAPKFHVKEIGQDLVFQKDIM